MKVLLACFEGLFGSVKYGKSYEYNAFYLPLKSMGHEVELFDFMTLMNAHGKEKMNELLLEKIKESRPEVFWAIPCEGEFKESTLKEIQKYSKTICFFHDDTWRVEFSRYWAKYFDYFTTTDVYGEYKYKKLGYENPIYFPFGANSEIFTSMEIERDIDVSFVGAWHPHREWLINKLKSLDIIVEVYGFNWPNGVIDTEKMVEIFNRSKISLNLSNSTSWDIRYLLGSLRGAWNSFRSPKNIEQVKGRHFEIPSCGSMQLSYYVEGLERCFKIGEEIAIYVDFMDLVAKIEMYLKDDDLRLRIAKAGYDRVIQHHTFQSRLQYAFDRMGF